MPATVEEMPGFQDGSAVHIAEDLTAAAGPLAASGDVVVDGRVCSGAEIRAGGNVRISGSIQSATIACGGVLDVKDGAIVGGRIAATGGIVCQSAGHRVKTPTELMIGLDEHALDSAEQRFTEIDNTLRRAAEIRKHLDRMVSTHVNLSPAQKEQVTDLLFRAGEAEKRAATAIVRLKLRLAELDDASRPECVISEMLFAGVTVLFPGVQTVISAPLRGPIKLFCARSAKGIAIHAMDLSSNKTHIMPSEAHPGRKEDLEARLLLLEKSLCR